MRLRLLLFVAFVLCQFLLPPLAAADPSPTPAPAADVETRDEDVLMFAAMLLAVFGLAARQRSRPRPARLPE